MRPTVLKTPELAAENTIKEGQRLPAISAAAADDAADERKLIDAERRKEERSRKEGHPADGFYNMVMPPAETNLPPAINQEPSPSTLTPSVSPEKALDQVAPQAAPAASYANPNAALNLTPKQQQELDILRRSFEAGNVSAQDYQTERIKILSEGE
jgi:hypothetical protein